MPTLRIKLPEQGEVTHELTADRISVGRRPDNTIQIVDRSVSGHHAEFILEDGHYRLHDLGSTNLCFVDGTPITDFHLHAECRIAFGTVQCEFDPHGGSNLPKMSMSQMEKDLAFMRGENSDLQAQIISLQRQIDILSSARLVTKKADNTPATADQDTLKSIVAERDDLRHLSAGLKLELEKLRDELTITIRERDAARQACELLQAEKVTHSRELQDLRQQIGKDGLPPGGEIASSPSTVPGGAAVVGTGASVFAPSAPTSAPAQHQVTVTIVPGAEPGADGGTTQKISLPPGPAAQAVAGSLNALASTLSRLASNPAEKPARAQLAAQGAKLAQTAATLGVHPIVRMSMAIEAMLHECFERVDYPTVAQIQTLLRATDLISRLLDPRHQDQGKALPHPKVLAVDDDSDLLHLVAASLELAHLPTTTCSTSQEAQNLIEKEDYDLLLLDAGLSNGNGSTLCERARDNGRSRKTPVIFLTTANGLDQKGQASLNAGNDFLPKPFNTTELTVKAETWIWKRRFGLL
jgi:CheY-like chemotaxis protein/predicted component of type VI protein secretion system